ncbi:hypothetical protein [Pseudoroseomonas ludipueritiae]|uniref:Uncharacterized protein n=1 Tax=Pseudoroseomonas ludipueritiae TaxID=198093 RepID=A0ABR7R9U7_9PROT|nr:hypothetical protein [Pseudoroseomonas ludipueritiae]MBC9178599.1 hypothetical protein [Pseudoroseomonas ludipueritiae]MCG7359922.1 hypothetical protein [Roseomonas sp. ACRSG]
MDNNERELPMVAGADVFCEIPRIMPAWDPNLIWDEGGWPVGCVERTDVRLPEKAAP